MDIHNRVHNLPRLLLNAHTTHMFKAALFITSWQAQTIRSSWLATSVLVVCGVPLSGTCLP